MQKDSYRGRFAPSPTGPLHFGSLVTALASYLEAKQHQGSWLLRIDDLDQARCIPGMDQILIRSLESLGFEWDEDITYQSSATKDYVDALQKLKQQSLIYACHCSRKIIAKSAKMGLEGPIYPDTCRNKHYPLDNKSALRLRTNDVTVSFTDKIRGKQFQNNHRDTGDFIVRRADGYFAYQLAVIVDDIQAKITDVVRGADLLFSSARQIYLYHLMGAPIPNYAHIPLVFGDDGKKLSKSDAAHPVDIGNPLASLLDAWHFLQQSPVDGRLQSLQEFWPWAVEKWQIDKLKND